MVKNANTRTRVTHPRAGIPSLTTVSWLLSFAARFFSLTSMTASKAVWVGPIKSWYSGAEVGNCVHADARRIKSFWARKPLATC